MPSTTTVRAKQGDTIDLICWRHYGRTKGVTELTLDANPGLADLGPVLPIGTLVLMPVVVDVPTERAATVRLWD